MSHVRSHSRIGRQFATLIYLKPFKCAFHASMSQFRYFHFEILIKNRQLNGQHLYVTIIYSRSNFPRLKLSRNNAMRQRWSQGKRIEEHRDSFAKTITSAHQRNDFVINTSVNLNTLYFIFICIESDIYSRGSDNVNTHEYMRMSRLDGQANYTIHSIQYIIYIHIS